MPLDERCCTRVAGAIVGAGLAFVVRTACLRLHAACVTPTSTPACLLPILAQGHEPLAFVLYDLLVATKRNLSWVNGHNLVLKGYPHPARRMVHCPVWLQGSLESLLWRGCFMAWAQPHLTGMSACSKLAMLTCSRIPHRARLPDSRAYPALEPFPHPFAHRALSAPCTVLLALTLRPSTCFWRIARLGAIRATATSPVSTAWAPIFA